MLWVLKRTVSLCWFFWAPKHMLKFIGKELNAFLGAQTILIRTYELKKLFLGIKIKLWNSIHYSLKIYL